MKEIRAMRAYHYDLAKYEDIFVEYGIEWREL